MNSRRLVAAFAAVYLLSTAPLRGDFTTIVNAPPDVIATNVLFGADTQINIFDGAISRPGELIYLGGFQAPANNTELNLLGGNVWAIQAWTGSQLNVVAGSVNAANLLGGQGTMSGGVVKIWTLFSESRLEMSGGIATRIDTAGSEDHPTPDTPLLEPIREPLRRVAR